MVVTAFVRGLTQLSQSYSIFAVLKHEETGVFFGSRPRGLTWLSRPLLEDLREPPKPLNIAVLKHTGGGGGNHNKYSQVRIKCK
jgi:hypothetical protein